MRGRACVFPGSPGSREDWPGRHASNCAIALMTLRPMDDVAKGDRARP